MLQDGLPSPKFTGGSYHDDLTAASSGARGYIDSRHIVKLAL